MTPTNDDQDNITDERLFWTTITTATTAATTTKSPDELDVQVPCSGDAASDVIRRRSATDVPGKLPDDVVPSATSKRPIWRFVNDDVPPAMCRAQLNTTKYKDDVATLDLCRGSLVTRDISGNMAKYKAETETAENSAYARCTATARYTPGEHDNQRRSATPPDVAADTDVLATAASNAIAGDRSPYLAVARAAAQATSKAVGEVIWKVREVTKGTVRDTVELELSARCVVRYNSSPPHRSAELLCKLN